MPVAAGIQHASSAGLRVEGLGFGFFGFRGGFNFVGFMRGTIFIQGSRRSFSQELSHFHGS